MRLPAFLLALACLSIKASAQVVINEVGIAPVGNGEFIELFNRNGCAVDVSCYTLVFSSTSLMAGNPTGWTIKIPSGKTISAGGYFLIGGMAGAAGVFGSGYPTGGAAIPYPGAADVDVGTISLTANAVYMKQSLNAGNLPNSGGQLTLLNASGGVVGTVSYNSGNNSGSYPLSAYTTCNATGNTQGNNNIANPGAATNNVNATFTSATIQGIYLNASGNYQTETSLSPRTANTTNGGTQLCSGPVLNTVNNLACCFSTVSQSLALVYTAVNSPTLYSISWNALPTNSFSAVTNALISGSGIAITVPANTAPGIYTGSLQLSNACGQSCTQNFIVTVSALPVVSAGSYPPLCINSGAVTLTGSPSGGAFSGTGVVGNNFIPISSGNFTVTYSYTNTTTGCTNTATTPVVVSAPVSSYAVACTTISPYLFSGQTLTASGLYAALVPNANGCTDTSKLYLTLTKNVIIDSTGCDSVLYEGTTYHSSVTFNQTVQSMVSGCDSLIKNIRIRVNQSRVKDTSVCLPPGAALSMLGQSFTTSGHYVLHTTTTAGCDSMIHLHLIIATTQRIDTSACNLLVYHGNSYTTDTTILETVAAGSGCDSILRNIHILIKRPSHSLTLGCAGVGQSYLFNGQSYSTSGLHTVHLTNAVGCDSAAQLYLTITQTSAVTLQSCTSVVYNGTGYNTSTIIYDTIRSQVTACDSLIKKVVITISPQLYTTTFACAQEGDVISFHSQTITTTGWYTAQLTASSGCDSLVNLYIVFKKPVAQTLSGCDSVMVNNVPYYQSTTVADTIKSIVTNCDSLVTIKNIVVNKSKMTYLSACSSNSYLFFGQTLTTSGNYTHSLQTAAGCDSVIKLYLVIAQTQTQTLSGCDSVIFHNHTYYTSITVRDTLHSTVTNCDSIIYSTQIIVTPVKHNYTSACVAPGQTYSFNGQTLTQSGQYVATFSTANCDSVVHLYLVVAKQLNINLQGCDSVLYNSIKYTSSIVLQTVTTSSVTACDSVLQRVNITVNRPIHRTITACVQDGGSYIFNGQVLTTSGFYMAQYHTATCDSFVHLALTVARLQSQTFTGCDSVFFNGQFYYNSLQLTDTVKSTLTGCDSLYKVTRLVVNEKTEAYISVCLTQGPVYNFNGQSLTASGNYIANFSRTGLCDSVVHLRLVVSQVQTQTLSGCDTVIYNNVVYHTSTILSDTVRSISTNCDSIIYIVNIHVNKKPLLQVSGNISICKGDTATLTATSPGNAVSWSGFGNGNSITTVPLFTTTYQAIVIDAMACKNTADITVDVQDFSLGLTASPNPVLAGARVVLQTNANIPYSVLQWEPLSNFANQTSRVQQIAADSSMMISVSGKSSAGCIDTAFLQLNVIPLDDIYVPSGFTPNGDGKNDRLAVIASNVRAFDFKIFNRWGQLVFHTADKLKGWDGTSSGKPQVSDTYVFVVRAIKTNGKVVEKKGTVVLIR